MNLPLVSVVIPTHNHGQYLPEALSSVLTQTYAHLEVIIVENGSTDSTREYLRELKDPRIQVVTTDDLGAAMARNVGIELANGEFLAFLDADDYWLPRKLSHQIESMNKSGRLSSRDDLCFTHIQEFLDPGSHELVATPRKLVGPSVTSLLTTRHTFDLVGLFNETLQVGEFIDWFDRAKAASHNEIMIPHTLVMRRVHSHNLKKLHDGSSQSYTSAIKSILDRRRTQDQPQK